jgi:AcrR family transcriptional regulator
MCATVALSPRDQFLAATEEALRESGMHGVGIKDIVARSGAPIGSLYHYFPGGKTQLVSEALSLHAQKLPRLMQRFFDKETSIAAAIGALFDTAADGFERAGADKGCAIGAVTLDLFSADAELRSVCAAAFEEWADVIAGYLPSPDKEVRRTFAITIVGALEGAFVLSRASQSGQPFREIGRWLSSMAEVSFTGPHRRQRLRKSKSSKKRRRSP